MEKIKNHIPGILFVFIIAIFSKWTDNMISPIVKLEALTIGIILGMTYSNTVGVQKIFDPGVKFSLKKLLKVGIVLLGFKLNFAEVMKEGPKYLLMIIVFVTLTLVISIFIGKLTGAGKKMSALIGVGSSICGASAIVALGPCIGAEDDDSILSVSVVSFLGTIGVIIYSIVAKISPMTDTQFGIWAGSSLHGVAHALAGAFARGEVAGEIGTFVKMIRVLMLVPVSIILGWAFNRGTEAKKAKFPMYVFYFVIAGVISSLNIIPSEIVKLLTKASGYLILMSMISMGLMVDFKAIKDKGAKAVSTGIILFGMVAPIMYIVAYNFFE